MVKYQANLQSNYYRAYKAIYKDLINAHGQ